MMRSLTIFAAVLWCFSSANAEEMGLMCFGQDDQLATVIAFHEAEEGHVAILDGDYTKPLPATWSQEGKTLVSFEQEDSLGVISNELTLSILSKSQGLTSATCIDVTTAAQTLNNDFGTLAGLNAEITRLEGELAVTKEKYALAQGKLDSLEDLPNQTASELREQVEKLEKQNAQLIKNSRAWQRVIADLQQKLQEN